MNNVSIRVVCEIKHDLKWNERAVLGASECHEGGDLSHGEAINVLERLVTQARAACGNQVRHHEAAAAIEEEVPA